MRRWFDDERDRSPFLTELNEVRHKATREGWCYAPVVSDSVKAVSGKFDRGVIDVDDR